MDLAILYLGDCSPTGQPLTLEFVATNDPATGGTLDYRLRITPTRDIDHLQIVLATEGVLELTAPLNETIDDAAEGVTIERTGSANITEIGVRAGLLSFLSSFDPSSDDVTFHLPRSRMVPSRVNRRRMSPRYRRRSPPCSPAAAAIAPKTRSAACWPAPSG